ncbi:autotransporter outer membrane beta-barrel domain-containing protein [Bartonella tribocorum]|uniref:Autotransporter n=1 Tax=Bartonella tribocorum (strain DSM 28219 / CCUG 45778 / CIP 105476 / IBS 506) TaxID=382640 RepID=A9IWZ1_BART1|nr:autotransporter outer membrane beta-barrel domain-containing protein [Bartonella tribocorum]CAK02073.1 autotransporter [Bartonella tribocorum CIP 105476]CDO49337.1 autotransporter [Bartonella tribocorum]
MIKVFRNHVCLCACTTAILSLLQNGREVYAATQEEEGKPYVIKVIPVVSANSSPQLSGSNKHKLPLKGESGGNYSPSMINIGNNDEGISGGDDYRVLSGKEGEKRHQNGGKGYEKNIDNTVRNEDSDERGVNPAFYYYSGLYYVCDNCGTGPNNVKSTGEGPKIDNKSYRITNENASNYPPGPTAITVKGIGTEVRGKNVTVSSQVADETFLMGVHVLENGKIVLEDPIIKNTVIGLRASNGVIEVKNGEIGESHEGVDAADRSFVLLEDTEINTANGNASLLSYEHSEVWMSGGSVDFMNSHGVSSMLGGKINLENVKVTGKGKEKNSDNHAVVRADLEGTVNLKGTTIRAMDVHGILLENKVNSIPLQEVKDLSNEDSHSESGVPVTEVNIKSSTININGAGSYGIYFQGEKPWSEGGDKKEGTSLGEEKSPPRLEIVNLDRTDFSVSDDTALYGENLISGAVSLMKSTLHSGNFLLKAEKGASITVLADGSTLEGRAHVDENSNAELYLGGRSTWILQQQLPKDQHKVANDSSISLVSLMGGSSIHFKRQEPSSVDDHQTLRIGKGKGEVYRAREGASIFLNSYLNSGGALDHQKTDRVLIHGDVSGKTMLHVHAVAGSPGGYTGRGGNDEGLSIIQVSGEAKQDSFQLEGGYVALDELPYQYKLYGYGPESDLGKANAGQRLVEGSGEFWDFRLESRSIDSDIKPKPDPRPTPPAPTPPSPTPSPAPEPHPVPKPGVRAVVPQVPTYLLLPNALRHLGLMNVSNQNKRLESLRIAAGGLLESHEKPFFFVRGYGGNQRYISNLSALEYGYDGELSYNALEAGVLLKAIENMYGTTSFGIIGSYEKFSLQPVNVEQSQKSTFDKWSVAAYGGMQHDAGFYVDGLVSYGFLKGDVLTTARGKTATLKGNPLSASLTTGKTFMVGEDGFVFDPQVQVVYQYLPFNKVRDVDGFDIDLGKIHQWVGRVGGRLTKMLVAGDEAQVISFYGKLHLAHGFEGKQFVHFKDAFQLGAFGSSLETGLGFNAQLSQNFALHGDLIYQHKLTKAGFSGTSFSGGLRYHF